MMTVTDLDREIQVAQRANTPEANLNLFHSMRSAEVYYPLSKTSSGQQTVPLLRLPDGTHAMLAVTSKDAPDLPRTFGGSKLEHAMTIAARMPNADGFILANATGQSVALSKTALQAILMKLDNLTHDVQHELNRLISEASRDASEKRTRTLLTSLEQSELYSHIESHEGGQKQATLPTYSMGDMKKLLRFYTGRKLPDQIPLPAGMLWRDIVAMVGKLQDIDGIQIVNNEGDYIVLGRDAVLHY